MARTKASVGSKISSGKSNKSRCGAPPPSSTSTISSGGGERSARIHSGGGGGGNSVCPRETPKWQRPITNFFCNKDTSGRSSDGETDDVASASTSKPKPKRNVIQSDDEDDITKEDRPKNRVLDETIELEPLIGEDSHKIEEYYTKNDAGVEENGVNDVNDKENEMNVTGNGISSEEDKTNGEKDGINGKGDKVKGKGIGKKTNKENVDANIEGRKSFKRDLEEVTFGEESEHVKKKKKVN